MVLVVPQDGDINHTRSCTLVHQPPLLGTDGRGARGSSAATGNHMHFSVEAGLHLKKAVTHAVGLYNHRRAGTGAVPCEEALDSQAHAFQEWIFGMSLAKQDKPLLTVHNLSDRGSGRSEIRE